MAANSRMIANPQCRCACCAQNPPRHLPPPSYRSPPPQVLLSHLRLPQQIQLPHPSPSPPPRLPCLSPLRPPSSTPARSWWSWSETTTPPTPSGRWGQQGATASPTSSTVCWSARRSTLCPSSCRHRRTECWAASLSSSRCCELTHDAVRTAWMLFSRRRIKRSVTATSTKQRMKKNPLNQAANTLLNCNFWFH